MTLDPGARAELERRGAASVRELLRSATGYGQSATVEIDVPSGARKPSRREVEEWLSEKGDAAETLATTRHRWLLGVTIVGTIAAITGVLGLVWPPKP